MVEVRGTGLETTAPVRSAASARLPDFPWDRLAPYAERARAHPDGIVDLSVGTPVDPTPRVVQEALTAAADAPGYPLTIGRTPTRQACIDWLAGDHGVSGPHGSGLELDQVLPVIGSKELVASLALHLGLGAGDLIAFPSLAYPTYAVGAALAGADAVVADTVEDLDALDRPPALLWLNSPSNPTGRVLSPGDLRMLVTWCRAHGTVVVSDECYLECVWDGAAPISVLHLDVCGATTDGLLAVHSLSKRSNLAGYRCGFVAGDARLVGELLAVRKNLGLMMPTPQQAAMAAALGDTVHAREQHARYAARRSVLKSALEAAGFRIDHSEASLYLWASGHEECWATVDRLADLGILVAPGAFYGAAGSRHVRVALTASDERIAAAADRLAGLGA